MLQIYAILYHAEITHEQNAWKLYKYLNRWWSFMEN